MATLEVCPPCLPEGVAGHRILRVPGYKKMANDVVHAVAEGGAADDARWQHLVVFPGDAQNWHEAMARGNAARYQEYSLDRTAGLLAARFPGRHVWMVRPSRYHEGIYACFDNFVLTADTFGRPDGGPTTVVRGVLHAALLLEAAMAAVPGVPPPAAGIALMGFSKGSIVLDCMLTELAMMRGMPPNRGVEAARRLLAATRYLHWVDGMGHPALLMPTGDGSTSFSPVSVMPARSPSRSPPSPFAPLSPSTAEVPPCVFRSVGGVSLANVPALFGHGDVVVGVHGTPYSWKFKAREAASVAFVDAVRDAGGRAFLCKLRFGEAGDAAGPDSVLVHHFACLREVEVEEPTPGGK